MLKSILDLNRLDYMTDGVHLAINFGQEQNELTKFYEERVSYL